MHRGSDMTVPLKLRTQPTPKSVPRIATEAGPHARLRANMTRRPSLSDKCRWTLALRQTTDDKVASIGQERRLRVG